MNSRARVSHLDAEAEWEHDDETGGLVRMLQVDGAVQIGLWQPGQTVGKAFEFRLQANETLLVLAGSGRLVVDEGAPIDLRPGVLVSLEKGVWTKWEADEDFRELWVYS